MHIIIVAGRHFLGLVADKTYTFAHLWRYLALEAAFAQQAIYSLYFVPALLCGHFRQVGGSLLGTSL